MAKQVSDWERFTQLTLNKKLQELKQKEKECEALKQTIKSLEERLEENKETINTLCRQIPTLVCNQYIHHA